VTLPSLSGKQRASRIPLRYFRAGRKRKLVLCLIAGAVPLAVWGLAWLRGGEFGAAAASPAPVHSVHAAWENQCSTCHAGTLEPTGSTNALRSWGIAGSGDHLCQGCHAGPPHHQAVPAHEMLSCAECHRDHKGRDASLIRVADSVCVRCHADLPAHTNMAAAGTSPHVSFASSVTRFGSGSHPEFKIDDGPGKRVTLAEARDPGRLRFNHRLHLSRGLKHHTGDTRAWLLRDVAANDRERYRAEQAADQRGDANAVQLTCASCHRLDARDVPQESTSRGASGSYMLTPTYATDCGGCHPLSFDGAFPSVEVPHHLQPADVRQFLWGTYAEKLVKGSDHKQPTKGIPLPGKTLRDKEDAARKQIDTLVEATESFLYQHNVAKAERYLYSGKTTCGLCHELLILGVDGEAVRTVWPPRVPEVWLPHARFSHLAHRAVDCRGCHEGADTSEASKDVLIPNMNVCVKCHAPAQGSGLTRTGGVRFDCVECHRYHDGDRPLHGIGSKSRAPTPTRSIEDFLQGSPPR
jgi:predicted CXXCH cytochrome family protein